MPSLPYARSCYTGKEIYQLLFPFPCPTPGSEAEYLLIEFLWDRNSRGWAKTSMRCFVAPQKHRVGHCVKEETGLDGLYSLIQQGSCLMKTWKEFSPGWLGYLLSVYCGRNRYIHKQCSSNIKQLPVTSLGKQSYLPNQFHCRTFSPRKLEKFNGSQNSWYPCKTAGSMTSWKKLHKVQQISDLRSRTLDNIAAF